MTDTVIRPALSSDITAITELLINCAEAMSQQNMHHWLGVYDTASVAQNMQNKDVFVLEQDGELLGCIALGTEKADYYQDCWPDAPEAEYYITQLAVSPSAQGKGYGKKLMRFCINKAGNASLQLDAVAHYPALLDFYRSLGFEMIASGVGLGDKRHLFLLKR